MQLASDRDDVALQYCNGYLEVVRLTDRLLSGFGSEKPSTIAGKVSRIHERIRRLQIEVLAERPDSLIVRKHGESIGLAVQSMAIEVVRSGEYGTDAYEANWSRLDRFLREPACRRNPGTTADLLAAAVFLASHGWG